MGTSTAEILILLGIVLAIPFVIIAVGWIFYRKIKADQEAKSRLPIPAYGDREEGQGFDMFRQDTRKDSR